MQLRTSPESDEDPQKIIILINSYGNYYALPFFSNTYRDYWNFPFEHVLKNVKTTNTTFNEELRNAFVKLQLDDQNGSGNVVIEEILFSLLHCRRISETDTAILKTEFINYNELIPNEDSHSCNERLKKNYDAIVKNNKGYLGNETFFDSENLRIYQFDNLSRVQNKKVNLSLKVYRQNCVGEMISL